MNQVHAHKVGLVFGGLLAISHAVWALLVFMGLTKPFLDWIFDLHFLNFQYTVDPFSLGNALMLVIVTGIVGYLVGYVACSLWNLVHGTAHTQ